MKFDWDVEKEKINIAKHKLDFADACHVFSDVFSLTCLMSAILIMKIGGL